MPNAILLLGLALIASAIASTQGSSSAGAAANPPISFCELVKHPAQYDGKVVTTTVEEACSIEGCIYFDPSCKESKSSDEDVIALPASRGDNFNPGDPLYERVKKILKKNKAAEIQFTIVALFIDGHYRTFGHQSCCRFKLEVRHVIDASEVKRIAQAQNPQEAPASLANFVQEFYDWYVPIALRDNAKPSMEIALKEKPAAFGPELFRALKEDSEAQAKAREIVGLDFDPFLNSQDPDESYVVAKITQMKCSYWVGVHSLSSGKKSDEPVVFAEIEQKGEGWQFINFHYPDDGDLLSILKTLRKAAGLPTGIISGFVLDEDGKAIVGATIALTNQSTKKTILTLRSNSDGSYSVPDVPPATYMITIKMANFKASTTRNVLVVANHAHILTVKLKVRSTGRIVY
ncbi:MAG: carboxypeptidase regulatory-like domain-containing protein [Candidatus Acidiferrales bacterium]